MNIEYNYRILLTRSKEDSINWSSKIKEIGFHSTILPCIDFISIEKSKLNKKISQIQKIDWIVFTSRKGVEYFSKINSYKISTDTKIAAIGQATEDSCKNYFNRVNYVGVESNSISFSKELISIIDKGSKVLLAVAENANNIIEKELISEDILCERINIYRTEPIKQLNKKKLLSEININTIFFASPSAVQGFVNQVENDVEAKVYTIGNTTKKKAESLGIKVMGVSEKPGLEGLIRVMNEYS